MNELIKSLDAISAATSDIGHLAQLMKLASEGIPDEQKNGNRPKADLGEILSWAAFQISAKADAIDRAHDAIDAIRIGIVR